MRCASLNRHPGQIRISSADMDFKVAAPRRASPPADGHEKSGLGVKTIAECRSNQARPARRTSSRRCWRHIEKPVRILPRRMPAACFFPNFRIDPS